MPRNPGQRLRLPLARQMTLDLLELSKGTPLASGEQRVNLRELREAISACRPRPHLELIFMKAYARVAMQQPALRRLYVPRPWPHLYEHPESVCGFTISRPLNGEHALFYLPIRAPDQRLLVHMEAKVATARLVPFEQIHAFRRQLRMSRMPKPVRRGFYRLCQKWTGNLRARYFGTFGMSVLASMRMSTLTTLSPMTLMLHYTPFEDDGSLMVRVLFDHRVFDGYELSQALFQLEKELKGPLLDEVRSMEKKAA